MDVTQLASRCPRCGRALATDAPEGLCASCLLEAAAEPLLDTRAAGAETMLAAAPTPVAGGAAAAPAQGDRHRLAEGQRFGPYQVGRLLGRGGMGEVHEAEHVESGRRVAIKVLRRRLHDAEDRARFLREGQLAASVSHPHTVYIFGSDEIDGMPVIAMELLPGGTLRDRVVTEGPLPYADAVAAVLDIVGGLDAAQAAGILHRDIKPSNCFRDADGAVKVGDFGLSISTLARDVQASAGPQGFEGTPQFAPPEQLRGEPLDVRADIYAVGATLYYLLTGAPPFEANTLRELAARVSADAPISPRTIRPEIPAGLAAIVLQCLAKDPRDRPASYAVLAEALRPWSLTGVEPARLGPRALAGLIDAVIIGVPMSLARTWSFTVSDDASAATTAAWVDPWTPWLGFAYYLAIEGATGTTIGKRLFGYRVVSSTGRASVRQIAARAAIFCSGGLAISAAVAMFGRAEIAALFVAYPAAVIVVPALTAALFLTARRANGFAAAHDLASGTRVVAQRAPIARQTKAASAGWEARLAPIAQRLPVRCGPFDLLGDLGGDGSGRLLIAFDPVLRRHIWIRALPAGTPPVSVARRDAGRRGRLHWLSGRRDATGSWDAYEAPDGESLLARAASGADWSAVKGWLTDLAQELAASERHQDTPALGLDRVWIRENGHAVLLDFPAPGRDPKRASRDLVTDGSDATPIGLLASIGRLVLPNDEAGRGRSGVPRLPLSAAAMIDRWSRQHAISIDAARLELAAAVAASDQVRRGRRALPVALAALPALLLLVGALVILPVFRAAMTAERFEVYGLLAMVDRPVPPGEPLAAETRAAEVYLAGRHRAILTDETFWSSSIAQGNLGALRDAAVRVARTHPDVAPGDLARATAILEPTLSRMRDDYRATIAPRLSRAAAFIVVALVGIGLGAACAGSFVSALAVPGGLLLRFLGLAVVDQRGLEISRARSLARVLVAWSPLLLWTAFLVPTTIERILAEPAAPATSAAVVLGLMAAGVAWTIREPDRGPVGRITRTRIVPR